MCVVKAATIAVFKKTGLVGLANVLYGPGYMGLVATMWVPMVV